MWRLRFDADDKAVQRLADQTPDPTSGVTFTKDGDRWLVETPDVSAAPEAQAALDAGNAIIDKLNFAVSLADPTFVPVEHSSTAADDNGNAHHFVTAHSTLSISTSMTAELTTSGPPPTSRLRTTAELVFDLAPQVPELDEVAAVWSRDRNPTNLYKVFEISRDQAGDGSCAVEKLVSKKQLSRFTRTVNHPKASGAQARHARLGAEPPADPMSEPEMVRFIAELIDAWLRCLAGQLGVATQASITDP